MKITKNQDNYLLSNSKGEYHFSIEEYESMTPEQAAKKASDEIDKKLTSTVGETINFSQARDLGFCEYGIKDFCEELNLDIDETYPIKELNKGITLRILEKYPEECLKVFGKDCIKYLGTVKDLINEDNMSLFLREEFIPVKTLHELSVKFAYSTLHFFEDKFPEDKRPRLAIEAKEEWIKEKSSLGLL
jgi:hypothetical protein|tara:strand:- start:484 stop:1050 length:567 start_codon:yes stop_codon:yes gene_type:complete